VTHARLRAAGLALALGTSAALIAATGALAATSPSTAWRIVYRSSAKGTQILSSVAATGPRHAWAVGQSRTGSIVLQWNGRSWRSMRSFPQGYLPTSVAATGPGNVWVFADALHGSPGQYDALRWNGHAWRAIQLPAAAAGVGTAAVASATDVWYSNGQYLAHWNGSAWTCGRTATWVTLAATAGGSVWRVEAGRVDGSSSRLVAQRWNGQDWQWVHLPHPAVADQSGIAVSIESDRNIVIQSKRPTPLGNRTEPGQVLQWNGRRWRTITEPSWATEWGLAATGSDSLWAGPNALWTGRSWIEGHQDGGDYELAGIPGTSATWLISGWIMLNGRI
jgi:hypothetical protein